MIGQLTSRPDHRNLASQSADHIAGTDLIPLKITLGILANQRKCKPKNAPQKKNALSTRKKRLAEVSLETCAAHVRAQRLHRTTTYAQ